VILQILGGVLGYAGAAIIIEPEPEPETPTVDSGGGSGRMLTVAPARYGRGSLTPTTRASKRLTPATTN
jgi:hypothetical protein